MIVSHRHRFIFLRTRKTAGTSTEIAFSTFCGPEDVVSRLGNVDNSIKAEAGGAPRQNDLVPLRAYRAWEIKEAVKRRGRVRAFNHMPAARVRRMVGATVWDDYVKFSVVRNPYDSVVSFYHWRLRKLPDERRPSMTEFINSDWVTRLTWNWSTYTIDDRIVADIVCRYENLEADLTAAAARIGLPGPLELPRAKGTHRSDRRPPSEVLTAAEAKRIGVIFAREIDTFGYTLE